MRENIHEDNFMALRFAAAVLVIYGHAYPLTGMTAPGLLGNSVHTLAVKVFFVISGYFIAQSWLNDPDFGRYVRRRALRIFPGLWVVVLLSALLVGPILTSLPLDAYFGNMGTVKYLENLFLRPNFFLPGVFENTIYPVAVNGSLWTLPIEFFMYLTLPTLLAFRFRRFLMVGALLGTAAMSVYFTRIEIPEQPLVFWSTSAVSAIEMAPYFLFGSCYRLCAPKEFFNLQVAVVMMFIAPFFGGNWPASEVVTLVVLPYTVLAVGFAKQPVFADFARFGDVSYGIYLYGFLVQQIVSQMIGTDGAPTMNFVISTLVTVPLGFLSWHLVERKALQWKPSGRRLYPSQ